MSYRTTINGSQLFGNNEFCGEWIDFIKSQGIKIDDDGNYKGEIADFMAALTVIEKITMRLHCWPAYPYGLFCRRRQF